MLDFKPCPKCRARFPVIEVKKNKYYTSCFFCEHETKSGKTVEESKEIWNRRKYHSG